MVSTAAVSAISAALVADHIRAGAFQEGPESVLVILARPASPRQFPAAVAISAIRQAGVSLVAARALRDGRTAVEFASTPRTRGGIGSLCHENVALGLDQLEAQGWSASA